MSDPTIPPIAPIELKRQLDARDELALLDVREPFERERVAIPAPPNGVDLFIPLREVPQRIEAIREAVGSRRLVIYCHHGVRSMYAGYWLATQGFRAVENLDGGIDAYAAEADPTLIRYH